MGKDDPCLEVRRRCCSRRGQSSNGGTIETQTEEGLVYYRKSSLQCLTRYPLARHAHLLLLIRFFKTRDSSSPLCPEQDVKLLQSRAKRVVFGHDDKLHPWSWVRPHLQPDRPAHALANPRPSRPAMVHHHSVHSKTLNCLSPVMTLNCSPAKRVVLVGMTINCIHGPGHDLNLIQSSWSRPSTASQAIRRSPLLSVFLPPGFTRDGLLTKTCIDLRHHGYGNIWQTTLARFGACVHYDHSV